MAQNNYILILLVSVLFLIELFYFHLATHFNILDKPNHRSSHSYTTIRGGGILFPIAVLLYCPFFNFSTNNLYFVFGLLAISLISFWDDVKPVSNSIRLLIHVLSTTILFNSFSFLSYPLWLTLLGYIVVIGIINAYNFMDGINGITGL